MFRILWLCLAVTACAVSDAHAAGVALILDEHNRWIAAVVLLIELPLVLYLTLGRAVKSLLTVLFMNVASMIAANAAQMYLFEFSRGRVHLQDELQYWFNVGIMYLVIVIIESVFLLSQQSRGEGAFKIFVLTAIFNAVTMGLMVYFIK